MHMYIASLTALNGKLSCIKAGTLPVAVRYLDGDPGVAEGGRLG